MISMARPCVGMIAELLHPSSLTRGHPVSTLLGAKSGPLAPPQWKVTSPEPAAEVDVFGGPVTKCDFALTAGWDAASSVDKRVYQLPVTRICCCHCRMMNG